MPITRTGMVDDDGTGTTGTIINNAWKTELYGQIDTFVNTGGGWTPLDGSGAGLAFTFATGAFIKIGLVACVWCQVVYPATANGANAVIAGLPFPVRLAAAGMTQGYGAHRLWHLVQDSTVISPLNPTTGVTYTNAQMSGANVILSGVYRTD